LKFSENVTLTAERKCHPSEASEDVQDACFSQNWGYPR